MVTDEERRRVAVTLRENRDTTEGIEDIWAVLDNILGTGEGSDDAPWDYTFDRLADLIDPDSGHDGSVSGNGFGASGIDRDALLALAEKLDGLGLNGVSSGWSSGAVNVGSFARRIRKALGVDR